MDRLLKPPQNSRTLVFLRREFAQCTATLIGSTRQHVLTAGHCLVRTPPFTDASGQSSRMTVTSGIAFNGCRSTALRVDQHWRRSRSTQVSLTDAPSKC